MKWYFKAAGRYSVGGTRSNGFALWFRPGLHSVVPARWAREPMSDAKHEKRSHFRGKSRPGRRIEVRYRLSDSSDGVIAAFTRNVGVGGAFILTPDPYPVGAALSVDLVLPNLPETVKVTGEVRWVVSTEDDPDCAGMGLKFTHLDVDALLRLSEYFASLTGTEDPPT